MTALSSRPAALAALAILAAALIEGCVVVPYVRRGPSQAHVAGVARSSRFLVKGRAPYLIVPRVSRTATLHLASGAIVRAQARDKVYAVTFQNDSGTELWLRAFEQRSRPAPAVICRDGAPLALTLPRPIPPGEELTIVLRDEREQREIRALLTTLIDRDEVRIRFDPGSPVSAGFLILTAGVYRYEHLPLACRNAASK
jgi:hypothetical protein